MKLLGTLFKGLLYIFIFTALILIAYSYRGSYRTKIPMIVENIKQVILPKPCTRPIKYSIKTLDPRFNITQSKLLGDLNKAGSIWNSALNKELFAYSSTTSDVTINLIYDYRQQTTAQLEKLGITIKDDRASYDALKVRYDSLHVTYLDQKTILENSVSAYNIHKNNYEQQVRYWNDQGGAPPAEYQKMQSQLNDLNAEAERIRQQQIVFNELVSTINTTAGVLNRLASNLNLHVSTYNKIGSSTGEEFNEGEYVEDASGKYIDIYQFSNNDQLVRVLEHEFGHALGLNHVDDPDAIMYRLNQSKNDALTVADISELKRVCSGQ